MQDNSVLDGRFIKDDTDVDYVPDILKPETGLVEQHKVYSICNRMGDGRKVYKRSEEKVLRAPTTCKNLSETVITTSIAKNGVVDFVTGDTTDTRLADTFIENKVLGNAVVDYLKSDPNDSAVEVKVQEYA